MMKKRDLVLRFADEEDDGVPFEEKMNDFTSSLNTMIKESSDLDQKII